MHRCFGHYQTPDVSRALEAYAWLQRGFMPREGGLLDQHPDFVAFVRVFDDELHLARAETKGDN